MSNHKHSPKSAILREYLNNTLVLEILIVLAFTRLYVHISDYFKALVRFKLLE